MKETTLREIQLFELDILKDVHEFCVANNIRYSLAYGTLIGAIRHKGFIPWDDDKTSLCPVLITTDSAAHTSPKQAMRYLRQH